MIPVSVSFEERLAAMTQEEADEECKKLGTKSALPKVIVTMRKALNLGSFFTTGADEVRQWTIRNGTKAPQAAGVIHGGKSAWGIRYVDSAINMQQISKRHLFKPSSTTIRRCGKKVMKLESRQRVR